MGDAIAEQVPTIRTQVRAQRAFLGRAVRWLVAEAGVGQFLDIGTGIPTTGNVHEVAQELDPAARVLYVDNDPIVLAHARALLTSQDDDWQRQKRFLQPLFTHRRVAGYAATMSEQVDALVAKWRSGVPFLMTEHGVYLRERYLSSGATADQSPAVKTALLRFHRALARVAYAEADAITQVGDYVSGMTARFALNMHDRLFDADAAARMTPLLPGR